MVSMSDAIWRRDSVRMVVLTVLLVTQNAFASQDPPTSDLGKMDLADLMNVKVTSVSKREQPLSRTAASVFVIHQDDIRRSGALSIPDLLRMVPGVNVEQIDAHSWAISIRGFNSRYSNKVLVLIDGRSVYTRSFSGVYWDQIDLPLENIDRIEVVRGPGGAVWGVNAVNGVISIFTRSSKETKGGLISAAGGSQANVSGLAQYGGAVGTTGAYRAFAKTISSGPFDLPGGSPANDGSRRAQGGFRTDWDLSAGDQLMVEGDLFGNQEHQTRSGGLVPSPFDSSFPVNVDAAGGNLTARWDHAMADGSETSLRAYFDTYRRVDIGTPDLMRTFDIDFQHHFTQGTRNDVVWGFGYRASQSKVPPGYPIAFEPLSQTDQLLSLFFQDEIRLSDSVRFTAGCKLEHNSYLTLEKEPSLRLVWTAPGGRDTVWASAARAVRQPSRADTSISTEAQRVPLAPGIVQVLRLIGNPAVKDEEVWDYELGYRSEFAKNLSLDLTTFLSSYGNLLTLEPQALKIIPGSPLVIEIPVTSGNGAHALNYGGEISVNWESSRRWRLSPGYAYLHSNIYQIAHGPSTLNRSTDFPESVAQIRSVINVSRRMDFDQALYYTARLPGGKIPGHARLDLRLARRVGESAEISLTGQNLLRPRTMEYGDSLGVLGTQAVRSVFGKVTWRF